MANATERGFITHGPGKWDLAVALLDGDASHQKHVEFVVETRHDGTWECEVQINGLEREDGSGNRWLFNGWLHFQGSSLGKVKGYFDVQTRRGWVEILEPVRR